MFVVGIVLRQRLNDEVKAQPQTPTVMVESHRKNQRHHEKQCQNTFILRAQDKQAEKADQQNHDLGGDDVSEDCAHEKAVLTLEEREAVWAVVTNMKQVGSDLRLATCGTTQSQTTTQHRLDLFKVCFQGVGNILT